MKKSKNNFKKNKRNYIIYFGTLILLIIFLMICIKFKIDKNIYCEIEKANLCNSYEYKEYIFSVFTAIIFFFHLYILTKVEKAKFLIISSSLFILSFLSYFAFVHQFEKNLIRNEDLKFLNNYYYDYKKDSNTLSKIYNDSIKKFIEKKDISKASKYLDSYESLNIEDSNIILYKYEIANITLENNEFYKIGIEYFEDLGKYEDSEIKLKELKYKYALSIQTTDEKSAMKIFKELEDYEDSKELYNKLYEKNKYYGTWDINVNLFACLNDCEYYSQIIVDKEKCYGIYTNKKVINENALIDCEFGNNKLSIYKKYSDTYKELKLSFDFVNDKLICSENNSIVMQKISDEAKLPKKTIIKEPTIGMTREEVEESTWGKPLDINKSTYSWGTTEQWVYSGHRYIYFRNGVVSSISE